MPEKIAKKPWISCINDRIFKEIILDEDNQDIVLAILRSLLKDDILDIKIETIERNSRNIHIRRKYFDCLLSTESKRIQIELNAFHKEYLHARNMAYISNTYASYTLVGQEYSEETEIIQINLTYGIKNDDKLIRTYKVQDEEKKKFIHNFKIIEINMDKLLELWYVKDELVIKKYKYIIMLNLNKEDLMTLSKKDGVVKKFMEKMEELNQDPKLFYFITEEQDRQFIHNTEIKLARKKGLEQGLEQGLKKGLKKGEQKGLKKGKQEGLKKGIQKAKNDAVLNLYKNGVSLELIVNSLELPMDTVLKIIQKESN